MGLAVCLSACTSARVFRLTDFEYAPKGPDASIDLFAGELDRPYESIAIIESNRYKLRDYDPKAKRGLAKTRHDAAQGRHDAAKAKMLEDLERLARQQGGDAVHKIRMLSAEIHGMIPDEDVPIPGAVKQGFRHLYFTRGEVVKYADEPVVELSRQPEFSE